MPDFNENLHQHANPSTYEIARILRKKETKAEKILWTLLRNRRVFGLKFRRQHPFENYVLDFYCHEMKLVIEADGKVHENPEIKNYDNARTKRLNEVGITVLRFTNSEIEKSLTAVLAKIETWVIENKKDFKK